jgi:diphosphomevalonate decarboxylase
MSSFLRSNDKLKNLPFESAWTSPANIALIKYWGKRSFQIPANPSLSMTLKECVTKTVTTFTPASDLTVTLKLNGVINQKFSEKINDFLRHLQSDLPWLSSLSIEINTLNSFPHGAGIASSASGLSAFALTLTDYLYFLDKDFDKADFFKIASYLSRLASGSACRSVYGGFSSWGKHQAPDSSDLFATPIKIHDDLKNLQDTILVINSSEKDISSRQGHSFMEKHPFAEARFSQARDNFSRCLSALESGDFDVVGAILELEALSLHAMMQTSSRPYFLIKPNTLKAIEAIWAFRRDTQIPLYFTLDAGPNLHLIYTDLYFNKIKTFISHELEPLCEKIIYDQVGQGPQPC